MLQKCDESFFVISGLNMKRTTTKVSISLHIRSKVPVAYQIFTRSKLAIETLEKGVKYI